MLRGSGSPRGRAPARRSAWAARLAAVAIVAVLGAACSSEPAPPPTTDAVDQAKARVDAAQTGIDDAKSAYRDAGKAFCTEARDYIEAIDRYGMLFSDRTATVGDVQTLGADLAEPRATTQTAGQAVVDAREALTAARQELLDAQNALAAAKAAAKGKPTPTPTKTKADEATAQVEPASIERVQQAEQDLESASRGITSETAVVDAGESYTSAAFALEVAWLNLFADAECLSDEQAQEAQAAVHDYTVALQQNLTTAGFYTAKIDGVYGPQTVDAVKELQKDEGLPETGLVDQ